MSLKANVNYFDIGTILSRVLIDRSIYFQCRDYKIIEVVSKVCLLLDQDEIVIKAERKDFMSAWTEAEQANQWGE